MRTSRIGSLFSGYEGLGMAVQQAAAALRMLLTDAPATTAGAVAS